MRRSFRGKENQFLECDGFGVIVTLEDEEVRCDLDDLQVLKGYRWRIVGLSARKGRKLKYAAAYHWTEKGPRYLYMHRLLSDAPKGFEVDHINGDTLDNRRDNLRIATPSQNRANSGLWACNHSGFRGVCLNKKSNRWVVKFRANNKRIHVGTFDCPIEAAKAYNKAALDHFGEFAYLNPIPVEISD